MAVASISSIISCKSQVHHTLKRSWQIERGRRQCYLPLQKSCKFLSHSLIGETDLIWNVSHYGSDFSPKADRRPVIWLVYNSSSPLRKTSGMSILEARNREGYEKCSSGGSYQIDETYYEYDLLETGSCERQLKELDSYFSKLHYNMDEQLRACGNGSDAKEYHTESCSQLEGQQTKVNVASDPCKRKTTLDSLENYFGELNTVHQSKKCSSRSLEKENSEEPPRQRPNPVIGGYREDKMIVEPSSVELLQNVDDEAGNLSAHNENIKGLETDDESSDFYLINLLVAINVAVFLFEIASPIKNSELETLSLPLVYGAKINKLILDGEWWRLLTPMFLHSGFLHVALSSWVLLTFGPQVCRGYGPFTFLLIYILGGICGNFTSFIHTPELTVCGTGPVFAIIGAWLVYQIQNKQVVAQELSESMFWKAVTATALSFLLSNFGRIDDWTHLGAASSGIIYGYLTCPTLQLLDNTFSSKDGKKQEGMALVQRQSDPSLKCQRIRAMASPTVSAPKRETDPKKRIVITGMGLVSVFGSDIDTFYNKLLEGQSGISLIDRFDASAFSVRFGGQIRDFSSKGYIDGKNDRRLDDAWRYCLVAGRRALDDANLGTEALDSMDKSRIGVLVGSGMGGLTAFTSGVESYVLKGYKKISPFFIPYSITNMGSALLAIDTGLMGPNYSISTACATANYCFHSAANHIRRGDADIMVAGGTEAAIMPTGIGGFIACRALSQRNDEPEKASRPWDKGRDGFVMGEGAGVLIMESLEHARKRGATIVAEYLGGAITCDAHHMTDPRKDGLGVSSCIQKSLEDAGVSPEEVNYANCHATSTLAGDLAEVNAIKTVFKDTSELKMNGTKSMIGHCLGAAGGLEAIVTIKAINTGWLHPTINQDNLEPQVTIDTVPNVKKQHEVHVGISNSFGLGGHNSVVVFAPFKP